MQETPQAQLKLTEPGVSIVQSFPASREYLQCYNLPQPPDVRYGNIRFPSPQEKYRVGLFGQVWLPHHPLGTILLIHGFSEHSANYAQLIHDFLEAKFAVAALDLRGHGLSEGTRGHTDTSTCYAEDVEHWMKIALPHLIPSQPLMIWAHSLGSLVALQLLLRKKLPVPPKAIVLSSALLGLPEQFGLQKYFMKLAPLMAKIFPAIQCPVGFIPENLTSNTEYLDRRAEDPLINHVATPAWLLSNLQAMADVHANAAKFENINPILFLLAGDERVTNLLDARRFAFNALSSLKHRVIEFPGYRHELEKEAELRPRIVKESLAWFTSHLHAHHG